MPDDRHKVTKLLVGQGVSGVGDGLWFSIWAIYLTGFSAVSPGLMGITIGITGLIGVALAYPAGGLADRHNARDILLALTIIRAIGMIGFCFVSGPVSLLAPSFAVFGTQSAVAGVRVALVCGLFPGERRGIDVLAKLRAWQHVSYAAGAGLGAVVLGYNDLVGFYAALLLNAATFFIFAVAIALLPRDNPNRPAKTGLEDSAKVLRDVPYLTIMGITSLFALCWSLMSTALPLWVHQRTAAPQYLPGVLLAASSLSIAFFQVQVSKRV